MISSVGKDSDNSDSRKAFIILFFTCYVDSLDFLFLPPLL